MHPAEMDGKNLEQAIELFRDTAHANGTATLII
jgi:hypothetical protein